MKSIGMKIVSSVVASLVCTCSMSMQFSAEITTERDNISSLTETDISLSMQTSIPRMLWAMENKPEYLGFEAPENTVLGQKFNVAHVRNGVLVPNNSVAYYPVSANGNIIAIVTLGKYQGEITTSIGIDFAPQLQSALEHSQNITLISADNCGIVAIGSNGAKEIIASDGSMTDAELIRNVPNSICTDFSESDSYSVSESEVFTSTIPTKDILKLYSADIEQMRKSYYTTCSDVPTTIIERGNVNFSCETAISLLPNNILYTYDPNATALGDYLDEYEIVGQGDNPICWAATIASMLRWEMPNIYSGYTALDVCTALNHSLTPASISNIEGYLSTFLSTYNSNYVPTYYSRAFTESEIRTIVNNEDPAYMQADNTYSNGAHATALCGYLDYSDDTFAVRTMNPGINAYAGGFKLTERSYTTAFFYWYGDELYLWNQGVRILYQHG